MFIDKYSSNVIKMVNDPTVAAVFIVRSIAVNTYFPICYTKIITVK